MRIFLFSLLLFMAAACRKDKDPNSNIEGNWKMIEVRDHVSGDIETKPGGQNNDVVMNLQYGPGQRINGGVSGHTLTNVFGEGSFSTPDEYHINIGAFGITDAMETPWGEAFLDNIFSASEYDFDSKDRLRIKTGEKTVLFQRQ